MPFGQKKKKERKKERNRSNIITNSIKTLKNGPHPKKMSFFFLRINELPSHESHGRTLHACSVAKSCTTLQPHGLYPSRLLCPRVLPSKTTGVGWHFLLQGVFLTQRLNPSPLHWQADSLPLSHQGSLEEPWWWFSS